jgi:hypothetical protein
MNRRTEIGVMMMTTRKVFVGTRPAASLHRRSTAENAAATIATYVMSSTVEMHAAKMKTDAKIGSMKNKNSMMKGTMITTVLTVTNLTGSSHWKRDTSQEVARHTAET